MAKNFVLQALRLLGLEEMLKLSQVLKVKQSSFKKAAGEELIIWNEDESSAPAPAPAAPEGKLLKFRAPRPENSSSEPASSEEKVERDDSQTPLIVPSEFLLWQRELSKEIIPPKEDMMKGYSRSKDMFMVKSTEKEGSSKMRFASTHGVLVNKKQA